MQDVPYSSMEHLFHQYLNMMHWSPYLCALELVKSLNRKHSNVYKCWFPEAWSSLARKTTYSQASIFCFWCSPPRVLFNLELIIQAKKGSWLFFTDGNSNVCCISLWDKDFKGWALSFWSLWLMYIRVTFYKVTLKLTLKHLQKLRSHLKIKLK